LRGAALREWRAVKSVHLLRRQTVEHPFGSLKTWMGATHFLTKTLDRVSTEMSLHVLAYNFKRLLSVIGKELMMKVVKA
jgi:hypothetical protein